jgi:hypothetical protein
MFGVVHYRAVGQEHADFRRFRRFVSRLLGLHHNQTLPAAEVFGEHNRSLESVGSTNSATPALTARYAA